MKKNGYVSVDAEWVALMTFVARRDQDLYLEILADVRNQVARKRRRSK